MIVKILLAVFWLVVIPYILGKFLIKKDENKILYTWILGNVLQMGIFFVISVPMILLKINFRTLLYIYSAILIILSIVSIIINRKKFIYKINLKQIEWKTAIKKISIYQMIFLVIVGSQLVVRYKYTSINDDDASFVTSSTDMIYTDKMYLNKITGEEESKINARRGLAPLFAYYAVISQQVDTHVTVVIHTVMPIVLICIAYILYYYFARKLFDNKDSIFIFLIFVALLNLYAFEIKGYNKYFFTYTWFGRAVLAAVILPFIWKICFDAMNKEKNEKKDWLTLFTLVNAGCLCSEIAVPLVSISVGALSLVNSIRDKKPSYILKSILCIIPCVIIGFIYLKIK